MIVVLVITASLGGILYKTLSSGLLLWERSIKDRDEWKTEFAIEKMTAELRNAFKDPKWIFRGTSKELYFASLTPGHAIKKGLDSALEPSYFYYVFDNMQKTLSVQKFRFENVFSPQVPSMSRRLVGVLDQVHHFSFEYYTYDIFMRAYQWVPVWNKSCFPETIRMTLQYKKEDQPLITRMINLPTGAPCQN